MLTLLSRTANNASVAQVGIEVTGSNIANSANANYARQRVEIAPNFSNQQKNYSIGTGAHVSAIADNRNQFLDTQILQNTMVSGMLEGRLSGLESIENAFGEQINEQEDAFSLQSALGSNKSPYGLSQSIDNLFTQIINWAGNPTDDTQKQMVIVAGQSLATGFQALSTNLSTIENQTNAILSQTVTEVNGILSSIATLNQEIGNLETFAFGSALDLRGQRQDLLEKLAQYIDFTVSTSTTSSSMIKITVQDSSNASISLLDGISSASNITLSGSDLQFASSTLKIQKGSVAGYQAILNNDLVYAQSNLDALAKAFVVNFNAIYNPASNPGKDFFDPAGITASTFALDTSLTASNLSSSSSSMTGANDIALALQALQSKVFSTALGDDIDGTFNNKYASVVTHLGTLLFSTKDQSQTVQKVSEHLIADRSNKIGVSYEEEFSNLVQYQHLYAANLRVLKVLDECLLSIMDI